MPAMSGAHAFVAAAPMAVAHAAPVRSSITARPVVRSAPVSTRVSAAPRTAPRTAHPTGWNQSRTTRRTNFRPTRCSRTGDFRRMTMGRRGWGLITHTFLRCIRTLGGTTSAVIQAS